MAGCVSVAHAIPINVSTVVIEAAAGRTWFDLDGDGAFEGRGGDLPTTSAYLFGADTRLDKFNDVISVRRSGLEFDLGPISTLRFPALQIRSATLALHFFSARDVVNFPPPDFGPPTGILHGYSGDGVVSADDMLVDHALTDFLALADTTVNIDIVRFIRRSAFFDQQYASFMLQLENDYQRGNNASAFYGSRHLDDPDLRPRLLIDVIRVPEPGTLGLFGIGLFALVFMQRKKAAKV